MREERRGSIGVGEPPGFAVFPHFDSLRAIAALLILLLHATAQGGALREGAAVNPVASRLIVGVTIFFLISGFLLYRPFVVEHSRGGPRPQTAPYFWRRLLRIVPAYWVALTAAVLLLGLSEVRSAGGVARFYGFAQIYDADTWLKGVGPAWTLNVEIAFYLFLPLYAFGVARLLGGRLGWLRAEVVGIASLVVGSAAYKLVILLTTPGNERAPTSIHWLPSYLDQFALGMGLAVLSVWLAERGALPRPLRVIGRFPAVAWAGAVLAFAATLLFGTAREVLTPAGDGRMLGVHWLFGLAAAGVLLPAVIGRPSQGWVRRLLANRVLLYLGTISYGIYLWHWILIKEARELGLDMGTGLPAYIGWTAFALVATTVAASASWFLVERPVLRLKRLVPDRGRIAAESGKPSAPSAAEPVTARAP
jgi:peptidoglycan/LPS O-acetylase OafA/YrhL